jgi:hypothetical protein
MLTRGSVSGNSHREGPSTPIANCDQQRHHEQHDSRGDERDRKLRGRPIKRQYVLPRPAMRMRGPIPRPGPCGSFEKSSSHAPVEPTKAPGPALMRVATVPETAATVATGAGFILAVFSQPFDCVGPSLRWALLLCGLSAFAAGSLSDPFFSTPSSCLPSLGRLLLGRLHLPPAFLLCFMRLPLPVVSSDREQDRPKSVEVHRCLQKGGPHI